jgi:hypothetical protein
MANDLQYVITLPEADEIMSAQGGEDVEGYTLENIELKYDNIELARKAENLYVRIRTRSVLRTCHPNEEDGMEQGLHYHQRNDQRTTQEYESHRHTIHTQAKDRQ